ncbi:MAG: AAA family ATPase [Acidimicrobiales bacterium]
MATQDVATAGVDHFASLFGTIVDNVGRVLHGKEQAVRLALLCLVSGGHLLVEDVPGVGKTSLAKALARSVGLDWQRVQFTPDLLPSDVTGSSVFDRDSSTFRFRPGAVFTNILLGDEINRASPKTQSSLLEAMQERQVTVDGHTHRLPSPFLVIATQNPVEHEGTFPLPESQVDRFLVRLTLGYPDRQSEITMLETHGTLTADDLGAVADADDLAFMAGLADAVYVAPPLRGYVVDLAAASRSHPAVELGMSPRATLALQTVAKSMAAATGRDYVTPDDIRGVAQPVLAHRLVLGADADFSGTTPEDVVAEVLRSIPVPAARP